MAKRLKERSTFHGPFWVTDQEVFGELLIKGSNSTLTLSSGGKMAESSSSQHFHGSSVDGQKITCIECIRSSQGHRSRGQNSYHYTQFFPHYVAVGDEHLDPDAKNIRRFRFSASDLPTLFNDFDAFGVVIDASSIMDAVLAGPRKTRPIEVGPWPEVRYFTGKMTVIEVETSVGKIAVQRRRTSSVGHPGEVDIRNELLVSIEPDQPINFSEAIDRIALLRRFLSLLAGRPQKIKPIEITTITANANGTNPLRVYWSYAPKGPHGDYQKPQPHDLPLDPVKHPEEFSTVLKNWIDRDEKLKIVRNRYLSCIEKRNTYDVDRLVAAANMFDLLPSDALPPAQTLPSDLADFQASTIKTLKAFSQSQDRDSAIAAITRMGQPSLPKKVLHRWMVVGSDMDDVFPDMEYVLRMAIKCRNHFVHGPSTSFKLERAEPFVFFLAEALEFVFAFSDLVASGWDAKQWTYRHFANGHSFARFRWGYTQTLTAFKAAMANAG
nr:hypothetical protein [Rhodanobacter sp. K2T2]